MVGLKDVIWSERILEINSFTKESIDIKDDIKVNENEDAIQQELFIKIMEIGSKNVKLSGKTREVVADISDYIAKKLVERFGHCCKSYCINQSETASTTHVYIDLVERWTYFTIRMPCNFDCNCFVFIDNAINVTTSSKLRDRAAVEHILNVVMFHEPFLCSVHWSEGQSMTHSIITNIYFHNKRKMMVDSVTKTMWYHLRNKKEKSSKFLFLQFIL